MEQKEIERRMNGVDGELGGMVRNWAEAQGINVDATAVDSLVTSIEQRVAAAMAVEDGDALATQAWVKAEVANAIRNYRYWSDGRRGGRR